MTVKSAHIYETEIGAMREIVERAAAGPQG
jgi:thymidylate synthase